MDEDSDYKILTNERAGKVVDRVIADLDMLETIFLREMDLTVGSRLAHTRAVMKYGALTFIKSSFRDLFKTKWML